MTTEDTDRWHRAEYEDVRSGHPQLPPWESLTEDQKAKVRAANEDKQKFFSDLGERIRQGRV